LKRVGWWLAVSVGQRAGSASTSPHRLDRGAEASGIIRRKLEGGGQARRGVTIGMRRAAFELLNAVDTQARRLGEGLLGEPGGTAVPAQQRGERGCRFNYRHAVVRSVLSEASTGRSG